MSQFEYKTIALPSVVEGRRGRLSEADFVAQTLETAIHAESIDGWEYYRAETLIAAPRRGWLGTQGVERSYTVLVFRRVLEAVWREAKGPQILDETAIPPVPRGSAL